MKLSEVVEARQVSTMAEASYNSGLRPRKLEIKESLDSLDQFKMSFRTYYSRDSNFKRFLKSSATWDNEEDNRGFVDETEGLKRTAPDLVMELENFLGTLASYLPFFLSERCPH